MIETLTLAFFAATLGTITAAQDPAHHPGEEPVAAYTVSNANAGTSPFEGDDMLRAFHGVEGINRIVDDMLDVGLVDPRTADVFALTDMVRLRRTLKEQLCYILNGGCDYTGRDMAQSHADLGLQPSDMGALVEHMQAAMTREGVPFHTQNRLLAKLAPMRRDVVTR